MHAPNSDLLFKKAKSDIKNMVYQSMTYNNRMKNILGVRQELFYKCYIYNMTEKRKLNRNKKNSKV